ncbi:S1 RNA-binding domain-containing protein [Flavihumibacter solisilvae]|uniref:RNA-binding protein S1 n=1 Tax=Flavihumibacter solisilvae TaxID=1349421 RepID=A0A0C1L944_9BACT|nr:S1-like domain-containing RNA-binding protein [Flavihumibacter solisilvae]KIC96036.1 RNA-binding protein S1 [Flavihumibacter solisilvae]
MIQVGRYNTLKVLRKVEFGVFLDDGADGILLPKRFVPPGLEPGDEVKVFIYHDSEDRLIATTQEPAGIVGDIVALKAVSVTRQGAFLDWGLMKDIFVPRSRQISVMRVGGMYIVRIYVDEQTGRVAATEKIESFLSNDNLEVKEKDLVDILVYRRTDIGYTVIINGRHTGVLHFNEIYRNIQVGDRAKGFIKTIRPENKIDVVLGEPGYNRVGSEADKILGLLNTQGGFLPYHDKSDPEDIYDYFGMSKKTFKMAIGNLFRQKVIEITDHGIRLIK